MLKLSSSIPSCSPRCPFFSPSLPKLPNLPLPVSPNNWSKSNSCRATKQHQQQQPKPPSKKKTKKRKNQPVEKPDTAGDHQEERRDYDDDPPSMPKPPAGFVLGDNGRCLVASNKRLTTIVDPKDGKPLECVIRRVFESSRGDECMLLCPVDTPVQVVKSTDFSGWSAISDNEVEALIPTIAYSLAKIHMHLVFSGFCYTARGGFCCSEEDILDFCTDTGEEISGVPAEGLAITYFNLDESHYMIYTPSDPLLFVAVKDKNGQLQIVDDDLMDDPAVIDAVREETEFNALVEEEAALLDSLLGNEE